MRILATLRVLDETRGAVRVEETYDTDIDDLWDACTNPERLARWIAEVSGDLRPGGEFVASFTSGWQGSGRVEVCDAPRRLLVTTWEDGSDAEQSIEVGLTAVGERTQLVIEESGLPVDELAAYGAGWQVHAEDLAAHLRGAERADMAARWKELAPHYTRLSAS